MKKALLWFGGMVVGLSFVAGLAAAALRLSWQDNSNIELAYVVLRQRVPQQKGFEPIRDLPANSTTWVDTSTRRNQTYCYMVVAVRNADRSYSNVACRKDDGSRIATGGGDIELRFASAGGQLNLNLDK